MTAARDLVRTTPGTEMHLRGHAAAIAEHAEAIAYQLGRAADGIREGLFGSQPAEPRSIDKEQPPQSLVDELARIDRALGDIDIVSKRLADLRTRIAPEPASGMPEAAPAPYPEPREWRASAPIR